VRETRSTPWLANHIIFFSYRWLAWACTALVLLYQGRAWSYMAVLGVTALANFVTTIIARPFTRLAQRNSLALGADMLYTLLVLAWSGGWDSPFIFYTFSSLILPGLLSGLHGWVMSSLSFVAGAAMLLWATDQPPATELVEHGWLNLAMVLLAPIAVGFIVPWLIESARQIIMNRQIARQTPPVLPRFERMPNAEPPRFTGGTRASAAQRQRLLDDAPLALQMLKTRTAEQSVEDLRRIIFMPLNAPDMELSAALDALATRFGKHTGMPIQVTFLGRTRSVHPLHRDLLVRLAQESLLNVQQHAHADAALLTLRYDATSVALMIQDNGVGLLDGTHERPGLRALRAMQYRLSEFGGRLDVFETEGGGVTVRATMPLD
jgi:hypothetical protein